MSDPDYLNPNREPVISVRDLAVLDDDEVLEGYNDGREGLPCGDNRSRSYWHGWRQGARDHGHRQGDGWDAMLARSVVPNGTGIMTLRDRVEASRKVMREAGLIT